MELYLVLATVLFMGSISYNFSFMPVNSKRCLRDTCRIDEYIEPTPKLKKIIRDFLKKSEKIRDILIYPEPDEKEDWDSGEIPWEPKNITETYEVKNSTTNITIDTESNGLSSYNIGMLFA